MNRGLVYTWTPGAAGRAGGFVKLERVALPRLDARAADGPGLDGKYVRVTNAGWIDADDAGGRGIHYVPIGDARPSAEGDFEFQPHLGGERVDRGPLRDPVLRQRHAEAAHFGEVNAYFHLDRIAAYVAELLAELGAPPPPRVTAVVNAHDGSPPGGGVPKGTTTIAFQGGHYRLPRSSYDIPEPTAPGPTGEIHLGPGRRMMAGGALAESVGHAYRHNAAHNAGTLYHEYGHHLQRHTADFRANALRPPTEQSNRKTATEEGTCDYWAAAMLDSPHIWAWHHRHDAQAVHRRSLVSPKTMADYDHHPDADPHRNGTIWGAALWEFRTQMAATAADGARLADRLVLQAWRKIGATFGPEHPAVPRTTSRARAGFGPALAALVAAERELHGGRFQPLLVSTFARRGIHPPRPGDDRRALVRRENAWA